MLPARFKALNTDSDEESKGEDDIPTITKEALEEKALSQYTEALILSRDKKWDKAEKAFIELLESDVLAKTTGKVTFIAGRIKPSLVHLKYCCYLNLGHVYFHTEDYNKALDSYNNAVELDDTDLNLLYKIGLVGMKMADIEIAIPAFEDALERSPNHFPSLDNLITALYAGGGHISCLYYISLGLERDPSYPKGLAFKERIFKNHPTLKIHYNAFYPENKLDPETQSDLTSEQKEKYYAEVEDLMARRKYQMSLQVKKRKPTPEYKIAHRLESWQQLATVIINANKQFSAEFPEQDFFRPMNLLYEVDGANCGLDMEVDIEDGDEAEDEEVDKINTEASGNENEEVSENLGIRAKRRRSSPTYLEQWMSGKRRSARVRSTVRKEEPSLARTLSNLIPAALLPIKDDSKKDESFRFDDSMDTMDLYKLFENKDGCVTEAISNEKIYYTITAEERERLIKQEGYFGTGRECRDISDFLRLYTGSHVKDLFTAFVQTLATKWYLHWPTNLIPLYISIFKLYMSHNIRNSFNAEFKVKLELGKAILLFGELLLDNWIEHGKNKGKPSPLGHHFLGGEMSSLYIGDLQDLCYDSKDKEFIARCWWLEALLFLYKGDLEGAIHSFQFYFSDERLDTTEVKLRNVSIHYLINKSIVEDFCISLTRKQLLTDVLSFYKDKNYEQVAEVLREVLKPDEHKINLEIVQPSLDRPTQFQLLLEACWELKNYEDCLKWGEVFLNEALNHYRGALNLEDGLADRTKWCNIITNTLELLLCSIDDGGLKTINVLEQSKKIRLIQSLSHTICHQVETGETDIQIETTDTWILIYLLIKHEEEGKKDLILPAENDLLPRSIRFLFTAHEYFGRRAWCCMDDAVILYQTLNDLKKLMDIFPAGSDIMLVLTQQLEQIFYCLYGHPIKRNKPRYVQEHNVDGLALTWERSYTVYGFLKPKELPTYDSSSRFSISVDTEVLFRRIIGLVPAECNPARLIDAMNQYIESVTDVIPTNDCPLPTEMADIYYLIADHYFKNKTWSKALRYYLLDVCNNPERVDSWACLALARGSLLEVKLNSCDALKSESDFLKKAVMSCRCYKISLDMDPGLATLWIEYGSFSYMVHSFCSRLLKQEQNLSLEMFEILETHKDGMLASALECFTSANTLWYSENGQDMHDERWLHHYMLGKIAEKKQEPANIYLAHYIKALNFLHQNNAQYPQNISYSSPQNLSVEALEVYYRVHACILKSLEQSEDRPLDKTTRQLYRSSLDKVAAGPFITEAPLRNDDPSGADNAGKSPEEETEMSAVNLVLEDLLNQVVSIETQVSVKPSDELKMEEESTKRKSDDSVDSMSIKRVKRNDSTDSEVTKTVDDTSKSEKSVGKVGTKRKSTDTSSQSVSDSDSSSDSESSSESSSDDDSDESTTEESQQDGSEDSKKTVKNDKSKSYNNWKEEQEEMINHCIHALEECVRRFPEHYKSLYRMAHYYFRSKRHRDVAKVHKLLLGEGGLFADRKSNNFFNGVWRIPSSEIDRPGSFASHMSRCVLLLLDVLRESKDHKMLLDLSLQLRDTPEPDKKYLRDPEREELCREALSLSTQALRKKLQEAKVSEDLKHIVLEAFKTYRKLNKYWPQREGPFVTFFTDAFSKYSNIKEKVDAASILDAAIKFSAQELMAMRSAATGGGVSSITTNVPVIMTISSPDVTQAPSPAPPIVPVPYVAVAAPKPVPQKPVPPRPTTPILPPAIPKRPRGRPSNISLRQANPNLVQKQNFQTQASEMAALYRNMAKFSDPRLLMQASSMMNPLSAAMTLQSQWQNYQAAELMRLSLLSPNNSPLSNLKTSNSNLSITPVQPKKSLSSPQHKYPTSPGILKPNTLITPPKSSTVTSNTIISQPSTSLSQTQTQIKHLPVSSASSVNLLKPPPPKSATASSNIKPNMIPPVNPHKTTPRPVSGYQKSVTKSYPQQKQPPMMPTNIKPPLPAVSLQHKLSAKRSRAMPTKPDTPKPPAKSSYITTSPHTVPKTVSSTSLQIMPKKTPKDKPLVIELDKESAKLPQGRDLLNIVKSVNEGRFTGAGPSGISISKIQVKPPEIKIPKDSGVSISPINPLKNVMSSLSPKEVTVTRLPPKGMEQKSSGKSSNSVTLSYIERAKKSTSPLSHRKHPSMMSESSSTLLSLGNNITITPTVNKQQKPKDTLKDQKKKIDGYDLILLD